MKICGLLREIAATYQKYGWTLRRVLLTADTRRECFDALNELGAADFAVDSDINAVWFSRPAANALEVWELRLLTVSPFALLETFDRNTAESERERILLTTQERIKKPYNPNP